jgi:deoxyribodipyrimidine photo-lyase
MTAVVMWFRRDLRLADHPALTAAAAAGEVVPLFVVDPAFATAGAARLAVMRDALESLDVSMGRSLVYRHGDPAVVVPALAAEVGASEVYVSRDYGPYGRRRDAAVNAALQADGKRLVGVGGPYAVLPGAVTKADGTPYAVFTPFCRAWRAVGWAPPAPAPTPSWRGAPDVRCDGPPAQPALTARRPDVDEAAGHARWEAFQGNGLDHYDTARNMPALPGTSRLSADLRWGTMHPRQLLAHLGDSEPHRVFSSELAWREFYADVLFRRPDSAWANLDKAMDAMPVDTDADADARFRRWAAGMTGYPIVDAGLRQLLATGWMHNRLRMIVASFLVKDLHLPWQWGARHFMRHLVDGDLASNSHGWQWAAGTGTDAAPYFRVFNPIAQSERFDPDGEYIRTWAPELAGLDSKAIHQPGVRRPEGYPPPMVDHAVERNEALRRYRSIRPEKPPGGR